MELLPNMDLLNFIVSSVGQSLDQSVIKPEPYTEFDEDVFGLGTAEKHGNYLATLFALNSSEDPFMGLEVPDVGDAVGADSVVEEQQWIDPFVVEFPRDQNNNWTGVQDVDGLPSYLMAGNLASPIPDIDYDEGLTDNSFAGMHKEKTVIKEEPSSPVSQCGGVVNENRSGSQKVKSRKPAHASRKLSSSVGTRKKASSPSRPLVERQKRQSDDDNESVSSVVSETPTDGSANSTSTNASLRAGLPSLPRITTVNFSDQVKRQRRDVSMSAPAVAARELRLKKKKHEVCLISECSELKTNWELLDRDSKDAQAQLERLREDALYLRSLVKSQQSTVAMLEYLNKAPFFQEGGQEMNLDARNMLRQISGSRDIAPAEVEETEPTPEKKKEIGGICLHINGSNISLHLCSHCSSEASSR